MKCTDYNLYPCYECKKDYFAGTGNECVLPSIKRELEEASDDEEVIRFVVKNYMLFCSGIVAPHVQKVIELYFPKYANLAEITLLMK